MNDNERRVATDAARSMRDRAVRVVLGRAVIPCALMMRGAANEIETLPLLEEFDVANQPQPLSAAAQSLKSACPPDVVAKADAAGVDWNRLADLVAQMLPLILSLFGK